MESGLEGRNNRVEATYALPAVMVSMESGLEGRNNARITELDAAITALVSMESGLEGRNNVDYTPRY